MKKTLRNTSVKRGKSPWRNILFAADQGRRPLEWDEPQIEPSDRGLIVWYCGVEVHKRNIVLAFYGILHDQPILGPVRSFDNSETGRRFLIDFARQFNVSRFLMETTGIYHYSIGWAFQDAFPNSQVVVMNARLIKHYLKGIRQNDKIDAMNLAQLARYEELLKYSYLPSPHMAVLREYVRQRAKALAEIVRLKNRIKKMLDMFGFGWEFNFHIQWQTGLIQAFCRSSQRFGDFLKSAAAKKWSPWLNGAEKKSLIWKEKLAIWAEANPPLEARSQVIFLFQRLALHECELTAVEAMIRAQVGTDPAIQPQLDLILNAPGLGEFGAFEIITEIGRIQRFPSERYFIAYAGIGPSGKTSGIYTREEGVEKVVEKDKPNPYRNTRLNRVLVISARVICTMAKRGPSDDRVIQYARRQQERGINGLKLYFKVASKLARCLFFCLAHNTRYLNEDSKDNSQMGRGRTTRRKRDTYLKRILKARAEDAWRAIQEITDTMLRMGVSEATVNGLIEVLGTRLNPPMKKEAAI